MMMTTALWVATTSTVTNQVTTPLIITKTKIIPTYLPAQVVLRAQKQLAQSHRENLAQNNEKIKMHKFYNSTL